MFAPKKMLQVIEMLHGSTTYEIHTKTEVSAPFELKRGIKERCPSSPVAFNLHHEIGLRRLKEGIEGITLKVGAVYQVKIEWRFQGSGRSPESPGSHKMLLEEIEKVTIKPLAFADDRTTRKMRRRQLRLSWRPRSMFTLVRQKVFWQIHISALNWMS